MSGQGTGLSIIPNIELDYRTFPPALGHLPLCLLLSLQFCVPKEKRKKKNKRRRKKTTLTVPPSSSWLASSSLVLTETRESQTSWSRRWYFTGFFKTTRQSFQKRNQKKAGPLSWSMPSDPGHHLSQAVREPGNCLHTPRQRRRSLSVPGAESLWVDNYSRSDSLGRKEGEDANTEG